MACGAEVYMEKNYSEQSILSSTMENWTQFSLHLHDNYMQEFYKNVILLC